MLKRDVFRELTVLSVNFWAAFMYHYICTHALLELESTKDVILSYGKSGRWYEGFGPGSSTAVLSTFDSSNPVSSTIKYLDFKVRLASIHHFLFDLWKNFYGQG